jgi:two-component system sensor histidine kinase ChvG
MPRLALPRSPRWTSRIWIRLLAFNLLLVFLPVIGVLTLKSYEDNLLVWQERSMVQQGRLLAAALAATSSAEGPLDAALAERILVSMERHFDARLRVVDPSFAVVADSARLTGATADGATVDAPTGDGEGRYAEAGAARSVDPDLRENPVYRLGTFLYQAYAKVFLPPDPVFTRSQEPESGRLEAPEVALALHGGYGSATRLSETKRSLTLTSALPVRHGNGPVLGAVVVTKSTFQILSTLYQLRIETFQVVLWSIGAAILLSLFLAATIARPIGKLVHEAAALLDRRGRLRGRFAASSRRDEVGDLSRALAELTRRLEGHLRFIESFAADVSHELRNPLASIRNAGELLLDLEMAAVQPAPEQVPGEYPNSLNLTDAEARLRFLRMIQEDVARLERLISGIREVSRLDADLEALPVERVPLAALLGRCIEDQRRLRAEPALRLTPPPQEVHVPANADRLLQVLHNLLDNARSFAPPGTAIELTLGVDTASREAVVQVADQGAGIPPEHLERIFERFFSYRPDESRSVSATHTGLGLAIAKAIVEGYGGTIQARNRPGGGAVFEIRLPLAGAGL